MNIRRKHASPGSVVTEMTIDIFTNAETNEATIMHDLDFRAPLSRLEYDPGVKLLYFVYSEDDKQDFGVELKQEISDVLIHVSEVFFLKVDMETSEPINAFKVPLKVLHEE